MRRTCSSRQDQLYDAIIRSDQVSDVDEHCEFPINLLMPPETGPL